MNSPERFDYQQQEAEEGRIDLTLQALESAKEHGVPEHFINWLAAECGVSKWWSTCEQTAR